MTVILSGLRSVNHSHYCYLYDGQQCHIRWILETKLAAHTLIMSPQTDILCITDSLCGVFIGHRGGPPFLKESNGEGLLCFNCRQPNQAVDHLIAMPLHIKSLVCFDIAAVCIAHDHVCFRQNKQNSCLILWLGPNRSVNYTWQMESTVESLEPCSERIRFLYVP